MAKSHRIFTAFAIEDERSRDFLVGQARNAKSPFEFTDMSVKQPWSSEWKERCRRKIRGCDGTIALVSRNIRSATGARWEIRCSDEEGVPILALKVHAIDETPYISELKGRRVFLWKWDTITDWLRRL